MLGRIGNQRLVIFQDMPRNPLFLRVFALYPRAARLLLGKEAEHMPLLVAQIVAVQGAVGLVLVTVVARQFHKRA